MAAEAFATANDMHYFETSAKDGTGVQELMDDVMGQAFEIALQNLQSITGESAA